MTTELTTRPDLIETKAHKIRKWLLRAGLAFAVLAPLIYVVAALGYRWGIIDLGTALITLSKEVGPVVMLLGLVTGLAGLFLAFFVQPRRGIGLALIALAIPLAGLVKAQSIGKKVDSLPFIHDITTDTQSPPIFTDAIVTARKESGAHNTLDYIGKRDRAKEDGGKLVSVLQTKAYPDIRSVISEADPEVAFGEVLLLIKQQGWEIVTEDVNAGIIEATDTTFWYGFKDDVIIRIQPSEGGGSIIDMRSVSRVGASDIGENAKRLRVLIDGLN